MNQFPSNTIYVMDLCQGGESCKWGAFFVDDPGKSAVSYTSKEEAVGRLIMERTECCWEVPFDK